ncbi:hypothetical protein ON010_g3152 [Phytophthora cinnamomi]|nr:hypothetical protein ON010_g3152 [Phytophthora cinnamomi]
MLSRALLRAPRRAWRLDRPPLALLRGVQAANAGSVLDARCFCSTALEEGDAGALSRGDAESTSPQDKRPWNTSAWEEKILAALRAYKELNGDAPVPVVFTIPSGDARWPRVAWGYTLGQGVGHLRDQARKQALSPRMAAELKKLDFVFNVSQFQWDEIIMPALRHYYTVHGHTDVPARFVVPDGDDAWPRISWNWSLGNTVRIIRSNGGYARQVEESKEELKDMKFCFETSVAERDWNKKILPALKVFHEVNDHCIVDHLFKVPCESPWPEDAWGLRLGKTVSDMRMRKCYVELAAQDEDILNEIGFVWDYDQLIWNERTIPALQTYVTEFNTCRMSQKFAVPACDPWPKSAWNMALGMQMYMIRYRGSHFSHVGCDVDRLKALGFSFELSRQAWEKRVDPLLEIFESCFGDRAVPHDFVIPSEAPWPRKMWGVHLGVFVASNAWASEAVDNEETSM